MKLKLHHLVEQALQSPHAVQILDELQEAIKAEREKRNRFINDIDEQMKAEFINGEVIIHSPVTRFHNDITGNLVKILDTYCLENDMGHVGFEKLMVRFPRNDYEPDVVVFGKPKAEQLKKDQKLFPIPDFIVEILSKSTAKNDREVKFNDYERNDVQEYWIIDPEKKLVEQYILENGKYEMQMKAGTGQLNCVVLKGLSIPVDIIFDKKKTNTFLKTLL